MPSTPMYVNAVMPLDRNGRDIQVLKGSTSRVNLTAGSSTSSAALPTGSQIVFVRCTDHVWINFGDSGVTASAAATSALHPAGESIQVIPTGATHIAVLQVSASCPVQVEKCDA